MAGCHRAGKHVSPAVRRARQVRRVLMPVVVVQLLAAIFTVAALGIRYVEYTHPDIVPASCQLPGCK